MSQTVITKGISSNYGLIADTKARFSLRPEPRHRSRSLLERSVSGRQQDGSHQLHLALGRQEGVDQGGADLSAEADV